jgi:DNA-binding LacI/PurR family transcriptional regulator
MVTIYDVAKAAKVAPKTAARILAGQGGRAHNQASVLAAAKKLGYVRNQHAANLRSGRSNLLGVIVPDISNPFYPVFFQTIHDIAATFGYQILLSSTFGKLKDEIHSLRMFEINRVEGIVLNAAEGDADEECDAIIQRFVAGGTPVILAGRPARKLKVDELVIRNVEGIEKVVTYLAKAGHRCLAFISGPTHNLGSRERLDGFMSGLKTTGLPANPACISHGDFSAESGMQQTARLLALAERPSAIVAANDLLALGAMRACAERGLKIPRDVAVTGFDDIALAQLVTPQLTTLRQPQERIARDCVNLLLRRIKEKDTSSPQRLTYDVDLIIRESS